jgi:MFS family permease
LRAYYDFLKTSFEPVFFGFLLTFFSSFGQTFLLSLFVPFILVDLSLTNASFGAYYAVATVISSLILLRIGHIIDSRPVRPFTRYTIILLAFSCLLLALVWHPVVLFVALIGLRLAGQGLLSHISISTMSRYFTADRGKALSISTLGYSAGEMIFPVLLGLMVAFAGWRAAAVAAAVLVLFLLVIMLFIRVERLDYVPGRGRIGKKHPVLQTSRAAGNASAGVASSTGGVSTAGHASPGGVSTGHASPSGHESPSGHASADLSKPALPGSKRAFYRQMLTESRFWILVVPSFMLSFTATGFFFYQYLMADVRGWPITAYTGIFAGYGLARLLFSLYGGILADRYRTDWLFVVHLLPMALGLIALYLLPGIQAAFLFLAGFAITSGYGMVVKNAIVAEIYGVERIGQIRSLFTMFMVLSTAIAPLLFGVLLDRGVSFEQLAIWSAVVLILVTLYSTRVIALYRDVVLNR